MSFHSFRLSLLTPSGNNGSTPAAILHCNLAETKTQSEHQQAQEFTLHDITHSAPISARIFVCPCNPPTNNARTGWISIFYHRALVGSKFSIPARRFLFPCNILGLSSLILDHRQHLAHGLFRAVTSRLSHVNTRQNINMRLQMTQQKDPSHNNIISWRNFDARDVLLELLQVDCHKLTRRHIMKTLLPRQQQNNYPLQTIMPK
jgi:hypothetical protein